MNVFTYEAVINSMEDAKQWKRALAYLDEMNRFHVKTDAYLYNATISVMKTSGQWERSSQLWDELIETGMELKPGVIT